MTLPNPIKKIQKIAPITTPITSGAPKITAKLAALPAEGKSAYGKLWVVFAGIFLLSLGNGLQTTLLGLRAVQLGFPNFWIGLVMAAYYGGNFYGMVIIPRVLHNIGHVRLFAALTAVATGMPLLHFIFTSPLVWLGFRFFNGIALAGLFLVGESWVQGTTSNKERGTVFSVYLAAIYGGLFLGQVLILSSPVESPHLYMVASLVVSLASVPMLMFVLPTPKHHARVVVRSVRYFFKMSPMGIGGTFLIGMIHAVIFSLTPVYAMGIGLSQTSVVAMIAGLTGFGALAQWPIGKLSDHTERRWILLWLALGSLALFISMVVWHGIAPYAMMAVGMFALPLYAVCSAHYNDRIQPADRIAGVKYAMMVNNTGSTIGPFIAGFFMQVGGHVGYQYFIILALLSFTALTIWALRHMRPPQEKTLYQSSLYFPMPLGRPYLIRLLGNRNDTK